MTLFVRRLITIATCALILATLAGCGKKQSRVPAPGEEPDKFLFDRGSGALKERHWIEAREYFRKLVDTYPRSQYRQEAKLGIGDSFLGEKHSDSDVLAANEFREFLQFYPLDRRADYAQYRLATSQMRQVLGPERDQTATLEALKEIDRFMAAYPNSSYMGDVVKMRREMRDRLSASEFMVGRQYYRQRWYPGAVTRLEGLLKSDPQFSGRDGVYFFLAGSYAKTKRTEEAITLYQKLIDEFKVSEYLKDAKEELAALRH